MISRELILEVIESFYQKATFDFLIGYHFRKIDDFDSHIPRIATFWDLQLNGSTKHKEELPFNLIQVHTPLGIKKGEIGRWMVLFEENLEQFVKAKKLSTDSKDSWVEKAKFFEKKLSERLIQPS